jgi:predicted transcriptional regulator
MADDKKTRPFSIWIDPTLRERLEQHAQQEDRSKNWVVKRALIAYLPAEAPER